MTKPTNPATKIVTGKVRFSYPHLFQPHSSAEGADAKYSLCILIPKTDKETIAKIKTAIDAATVQGLPTWGGKKPAALKLPIRDGDTERADDEAYAGMWFLNCSSKQAPGVIDANKQPVLDRTEVYAGCYGRVSINFFPYSQAGNKGIGVGLHNVQKLAEGEALGGRAKAEDDFADDAAGDDSAPW